MNSICIWYNPNKDLYYHKVIHGFATNYFIGKVNSYGHILVYIFRLENYYVPYKNRLKKKVVNYLIKELKNI